MFINTSQKNYIKGKKLILLLPGLSSVMNIFDYIQNFKLFCNPHYNKSKKFFLSEFYRWKFKFIKIIIKTI